MAVHVQAYSQSRLFCLFTYTGQWAIPEYLVTCRWPTHCHVLRRDSEKPGSLGTSSPELAIATLCSSQTGGPEHGFCMAVAFASSLTDAPRTALLQQ